MTLKTSYFKWMKEDWKRRKWTIVVFGILCFILTVSFEMSIEAFEQGQRLEGSAFFICNSIETILRYGKIYFYTIESGIGALLFGFQGFSWLMKKEQVDFYHSQPMKREKRFLLLYVDGILLYECMMILHMIILSILIGMRGYLSGGIVKCMLWNLISYSVIFLLIYSIVVLAVMLTGNLVVAFMASGTLLFYPIMVKILLQSYSVMYFQTYTEVYNSSMDIVNVADPFQTILSVIKNLIAGSPSGGFNNILQACILSVVAAIVAFFLYKWRPSECAGKALAFPFLGSVIRILLVIPTGMVLGLCLTAFQVGDADIWLYFGTVLGVVLMHGFMEVVFQSDIRACLGKKKQLLLSLLLTVGIVSVFRYDMVGYDNYLPEAEKIAEASCNISVGDYAREYTNYIDYYKLNEEGVPLFAVESMGATEWGYTETEYQLQISSASETKAILRLVKGHMENQGPDYDAMKSVLVRYKLKSGKEVYRQYYMDEARLKQYFAALYETKEGKELMHPYIHLAVEQAKTVSVCMGIDGEERLLALNEEERKQLQACYQKDIEENTYEEFFNNEMLGYLSFCYQVKDSKESAQINWIIAKQYENTLNFLRNKGITF